MKKFLFILFIHLCCYANANMASPFIWGTIGSNAFGSKDIDILHETIRVVIDKDFQTASYKIKYVIKSRIEGPQIPLMFYAEDFKTNFKAQIDGKDIKLIPISAYLKKIEGSIFSGFSKSIKPPSREGESPTITIKSPTITIMWSEKTGFSYRLSDLKYFYVDLTKGEHIIEVEYTGSVSEYHNDAYTEYGFFYSLSPAEHWRSFGTLDIIVDAHNVNQKLESNLGNPTSGSLDSIATWKFNKLPAMFFEIFYQTKGRVHNYTWDKIDSEGNPNRLGEIFHSLIEAERLRQRNRTILITIGGISVCLLALLWKKFRKN